jgi:CRP-like cAMP-binding protein
MELQQILQSIELFEGLEEKELAGVASICRPRRCKRGELLAREGEPGNELFIITEGFVEVLIGKGPGAGARVVVSLGAGQITGEMALLDQGARSASVRATSEPTLLQVIDRQDFEALCEKDTRIGYIVMRNLAADLSFKLRHRNLSER